MILSQNAPIKALSVAGPFPWRLANGKKAIELRSWSTSYRGIVLLHSSSGGGYEHLFAQFGLSRNACPKYALVGAAKLVDCVRYDSPEKWNADLSRHCWAGEESYEEVIDLYGDYPFGHVLADAIAFDNPILDVPGARNYWEPRNDRQKIGFEKAMALLGSIGYLS